MPVEKRHKMLKTFNYRLLPITPSNREENAKTPPESAAIRLYYPIEAMCRSKSDSIINKSRSSGTSGHLEFSHPGSRASYFQDADLAPPPRESIAAASRRSVLLFIRPQSMSADPPCLARALAARQLALSALLGRRVQP